MGYQIKSLPLAEKLAEATLLFLLRHDELTVPERTAVAEGITWMCRAIRIIELTDQLTPVGSTAQQPPPQPIMETGLQP